MDHLILGFIRYLLPNNSLELLTGYFSASLHSPPFFFFFFSQHQFFPPSCKYVCVLCLVAQSCLTLCDPMDCSPPGSSVHEDSPGKSTGVDSHALLQGIFPTQGSNPGLLYCRWTLYWPSLWTLASFIHIFTCSFDITVILKVAVLHGMAGKISCKSWCLSCLFHSFSLQTLIYILSIYLLCCDYRFQQIPCHQESSNPLWETNSYKCTSLWDGELDLPEWVKEGILEEVILEMIHEKGAGIFQVSKGQRRNNSRHRSWNSSYFSPQTHTVISHHLKMLARVCLLSHFSHVWLHATLWTVAHQTPLSMGFSMGFSTPILEWVAMLSSRESSWPRDWKCISYISYIGRQVLYRWYYLGIPQSAWVPK